MKNLVRVCVADAAEQTWIGERTLNCVVFACEPFCKVFDRRSQNFECSAIKLGKFGFALSEVQRRSFFGASLRQQERARWEIKGRQSNSCGNRSALLPPLKAAGNHKMNDEENLVVKFENDLLAKPAYRSKNASLN